MWKQNKKKATPALKTAFIEVYKTKEELAVYLVKERAYLDVKGLIQVRCNDYFLICAKKPIRGFIKYQVYLLRKKRWLQAPFTDHQVWEGLYATLNGNKTKLHYRGGTITYNDETGTFKQETTNISYKKQELFTKNKQS